jgi:hypothetical protein
MGCAPNAVIARILMLEAADAVNGVQVQRRLNILGVHALGRELLHNRCDSLVFFSRIQILNSQ